MDNLIHRLYDMTREMVEQLETAEYEELERFVDERERLLQELKELRSQHQPQDRHQEMIRQVLAWDRIIEGRMMQLKSEAAGRLRRLRENRIQHNAYSPTYITDGVYIDKRK
jgi:glycine cleavage system protein P-like pyridoxal-binding family